MLTRYVNDEEAERIYAAEMTVRDMALPAERRFQTLPEISEYIREVQARRWFAWPQAQWAVTVKYSDRQTADYRSGTVFVPQLPALFYMAARELVILHELAHHLAGLTHKHGPVFVAAFLDLVHGVLPSAAEPLQRELTRVGAFNA